MTVLVADKNTTFLEEIQKDVDSNLLSFNIDVSKQDEWESLQHFAVEKLQGISSSRYPYMDT